MRRIIFIFFSILFLSVSLSAQKSKTITVKAGRNVKDYFPLQERYRYAEFSMGKAVFRNGIFSEVKFNYNLLNDDIEFLKGKDTLSISNNKKDISYIVIQADTFVYDNGFIEIISNGLIKVGMRSHYKLNEIQKTDTYGISSPASARESYNSMPIDGNFYKFRATTDMVFSQTTEYYLSKSFRDFVSYRKNNVLKLFPEKEAEIKSFLKSNKIDFDSETDLEELTKFLESSESKL